MNSDVLSQLHQSINQSEEVRSATCYLKIKKTAITKTYLLYEIVKTLKLKLLVSKLVVFVAGYYKFIILCFKH